MDSKIRKALETGQTIDITTRGRKSGLLRRMEISFQYLDGRRYIHGGTPGPRDWLANLHANPEFVFHLKETVKVDLAARARIIVDEAERRSLFSRFSSATRTELEAQVAASPLLEVEIQLDD